MESSLTVAEDIQLMQLGKIMAVGLYPDRVIVMHCPPGANFESTHIRSLALLMTLKGLPVGEHEIHMTIEFPNGKGKMEARNSPAIVDRTDASINLMMAFMPFPVVGTGQFTVRASTSGYSAEQHFWVTSRDLTKELAGLPQPAMIAGPMPTKAPAPTPAKKMTRKHTAERAASAASNRPIQALQAAAKKTKVPSRV